MRAVGAANYWMDNPSPTEPLRFRRVPVLAAAVCFAVGDALARRWHAPGMLAGATLGLLLVAVVALVRQVRVVAVAVLGFWIAVGLWCAQIQPPVSQQTELIHFADGLSRTVRGRVARVRELPATLPPGGSPVQTPVQPWMAEPGAWEAPEGDLRQSVDLDVESVEEVSAEASTMQPVAGGVRVTVLGAALPLRCGDTVEVPLRLRVPDAYRDPGAFSEGAYLLGEGIGLLGSVRAERVRDLHEAKPGWRCRLFAAQAAAAHRLQAFAGSRANHGLPRALQLSSEDTAMLSAMLFGDRTRLTHALRTGFERTGTFHLFVVSGLHVALLAGVLFSLLRRLRLPEGAAVVLTLFAATGYALLTGFGVPVQRALGMTAIYLLAKWLGRETSALNALGAAALGVLALDPRALFDASFQMTFLVIFAVAGLAAPLMERTIRPWARALQQLDVVAVDAWLPPQLAQFRVRLRMFRELCGALLGRRLAGLPLWGAKAAFWCGDVLLLGVTVEACMIVPMAVYFHRATLFALPLNLVDIPLVSVLVCLAVVTFLAALVSSRLAVLAGAPTALLLHLLQGTVGHTQRLALADVRVPAPPGMAIAAACVLIAFGCWALRARTQRLMLAGCAGLMCVPLAVFWPAPPLLHAGMLEVTAIDVGQGDSLLVGSPDGKAMLVDAGGPVGRLSTAEGWDVGEEVVAPYLWTRRIRRLDAVVLTHAHSDHMGGMPAILRDFRPRELWLSVQPGEAPALQALLSEAAELGVKVRRFHAGEALPWGSVQVSVLAPEAGYANTGEPVNDDSLVMRLQYGRASVLLEGDAEQPSEEAMVSGGRVAPATLLKVGHHGSRTSTNPEFLNAVQPKEAVISVGRRNTFGHPRGEILERLQSAGVKTFRTDRQGAETFLLTADGGISSSSAASNGTQ